MLIHENRLSVQTFADLYSQPGSRCGYVFQKSDKFPVSLIRCLCPYAVQKRSAEKPVAAVGPHRAAEDAARWSVKAARISIITSPLGRGEMETEQVKTETIEFIMMAEAVSAADRRAAGADLIGMLLDEFRQ